MLLRAPARVIQTMGRLTEKNKNIERMQKKKKNPELAFIVKFCLNSAI